jgi:hypothetical protein
MVPLQTEKNMGEKTSNGLCDIRFIYEFVNGEGCPQRVLYDYVLAKNTSIGRTFRRLLHVSLANEAL